jgi:hypothetical protein
LVGLPCVGLFAGCSWGVECGWGVGGECEGGEGEGEDGVE